MIPDLYGWIERGLLLVVTTLTLIAAGNEVWSMVLAREVTLADLLLMFLYTEVISMISIFYSSRRIPVVYPIFIAITALARLIVLQSKDMAPEQMLYEAAAVAALTLSVAILRFSGHFVRGDEE